MTGTEAFALAKNKAGYSDYSWVVWENKDGSFSAERASTDTLKCALLAIGTQGSFYLFQARDRCSQIMTWGMGIIVWRQFAKHHRDR
jgi:hypothetical protein